MSPESFNLRGVSCMGAGNRTQTQWRGSENREVLSHFASGTPGRGFLGDSQPECGQQSQMNSQAGLLQAVRESKRSSFPLKSKLGKTKSFPHVSLSWTEIHRVWNLKRAEYEVKGLYHQRLWRERQKQWNQPMSESSVLSAPPSAEGHEVWGERMRLGTLFGHHIIAWFALYLGTTQSRGKMRKEGKASLSNPKDAKL